MKLSGELVGRGVGEKEEDSGQDLEGNMLKVHYILSWRLCQ